MDVLDEVERLLPRIARRLLFEVAADSPMWDLTPPQVRTLHILGFRGHLTMGELGERLGVAVSTVTQIADRLEQRGWVQRVDDREDRRVVRLALTEAGQQMIEERRQRRRERIREALARIPADKQQALVEGLRALAESAGYGGECPRQCSHSRPLLDWVREELDPVAAAEEGRGERT